MNFKKNGGFTLVELIVVIAILGILAGIGIPAYGKYVEKAQIAVDNQNLNMLHNVFVVSCVEHGVDPGMVSVTGIDYQNNVFKGITQVSGASAAYHFRRSGGTSEDKNALIVTSFNGYIGTEGIQFKSKDMTANKIMEGIMFGVETEGGSTGGKYTSSFEAVKDQIAGSVSTFQNSNFNKVGATTLMGKVDNVTGIASALFAEGGNLAEGLAGSVLSNPDGLYDYFGLTGEDRNLTVLDEKLGAMEDDARNDLFANYAVLLTAKNTTSTQASGWLTDLKTNATDPNKNLFDASDIKSMMSGSDAAASQEGVSQAAMIYAMYTAYAQTLEGEEKAAAEANTNDIGTFVSNVNKDAGFRAYLQTDAATTDMNGYLAALDIINKSTSNNTDTTNDLLTNGFANKDLTSALEGLLGK